MEPDILCDSYVRRGASTVTIANSNGGQFTYRGTGYSAWVNGTLIRGTDMLFVGDGDASCRSDLDFKAVEASVASQLANSRRTAEVRTAELPVIFTPLRRRVLAHRAASNGLLWTPGAPGAVAARGCARHREIRRAALPLG